MAELLRIYDDIERSVYDETEQRFNELITKIETAADTLAPEERKELVLTPVCKEPGTMDQGYRHD